MNFDLDTNNQNYAIASYDNDSFIVNNKKYRGALFISDLEIKVVEGGDSLVPDNVLKEIIKANPDILIVGTGQNHQLPDKKLYLEMAKHNIALELMSTDAACRTYNVLISEERKCMAFLNQHHKLFN